MVLYRDVLKRAWTLAWQYKPLWLFGFFAAFWGVGNVYGVAIQGMQLAGGQDFFIVNLWNDIAAAGITWQAIGSIITGAPLEGLKLLSIIIGLLLLIFFLYWVFTVSQAAVIRQVSNIEQHQPRKLVDVFIRARSFFWPTFWMNIMGKAAVSVVLLLVSTFAVTALVDEVSLAALSGYIILFILGVLAILVISFLVVYAIIYLVVQNYRFSEALAASWRLFTHNWLVSFETAAILLGVSIVAAVAAFLGFIILSVPVVISLAIGFETFTYIILFITALVFFVFLFLLFSWLTTFQLAVWTELVTHLETGSIESKVRRVTKTVGVQ